ncbi:outer membrane lipoprotein-sorting protein [Thermospira aquatica]|uniref:Outer membrane lipoprotein-sorting protein n=1 Tax=Thermospira aquatica TaxID=2828656 RepID=A0AAX3BFJ5_9SPIR|nr:outer membrane lipoprotein-sorting protein [Thermospira aquatica]URA11006.1 outer membrane lipoprotein-sorting protein [Thermospira aquatica]
MYKGKSVVGMFLMMIMSVMMGQDVQTLLQKVEHAQRAADSYVGKMLLTTYDGERKTGEASLELYVKGLELSIARYLTPSGDRGKAILQRGRDYWFYFPKTRQSVKISPKQRLLGDAMVGDVVKPPLLATYTVTLVSNTSRESVFELVAKDDSAPYQYILLWWNTAEEKITKEEFYTRTRVHLKTARYLAHRRIKNYNFATKVEIQDALVTNKKTEIEMVDLQERVLRDQIFYPESLDYLPYTYR